MSITVLSILRYMIPVMGILHVLAACGMIPLLDWLRNKLFVGQKEHLRAGASTTLLVQPRTEKINEITGD